MICICFFFVVIFLNKYQTLTLMESDNKLKIQRIENLNNLKSLKVNPYPYTFNQTHHASEILKKYEKLANEEKTKDKVSVAGRIMTLRMMGKAAFGHLQDDSGKIQFYIREDNVGGKIYSIFKNFDLGDIAGVSGIVFRTKTGEVSVWVENIELLSKSLLPLPEKFHGLKDTEIRYRQRYLDMVMNPEVKRVFEKRATIVREMRSFLDSRGFIEVEIPVLQPVYGGAAARPFITHVNSLNRDFYLQISPELYLKRLIIGGMEKVYFLGKNFRNEDIDRTHNPEFSMMECYEAYVDYNTVMKLTEDMIEHICKKVNGTTKIKYNNNIIDFKAPWTRITMFEAIKKFAKLDVEKMSDTELKSEIHKAKLEAGSRDEMINELFEHYAESKLIQPTFITDYPLTICPLTKVHRKNPKLVERFEAFVNGTELANAYSELNDPIEQDVRFSMQEKNREEGDEEAHPIDKDFVTAMEYGMPPCGGLGIGVDRLVIFLTAQESIRDVIPFPLMKTFEDK